MYCLSSKQAIKLCSIVLPLMNVLSLLEAHGEYFRVLFKMFFWRFDNLFLHLCFSVACILFLKCWNLISSFHSRCCLYLELCVSESLSNPWRDRMEYGTGTDVSQLNSQRLLLRKSLTNFLIFIVRVCFHRIVLHLLKPADAFFWALDNPRCPEYLCTVLVLWSAWLFYWTVRSVWISASI